MRGGDRGVGGWGEKNRHKDCGGVVAHPACSGPIPAAGLTSTKHLLEIGIFLGGEIQS